MNALIIGCGTLGRKIAQMLDQAGWDVSVIDDREDMLELLEADFSGAALHGFPMDLQSLKEAGIESCDAVAVTTADDSMNIAVAQIARDYFGVQNVVARIADPARESIFESLGLRTVCSTNLAGEQIVSLLTGEKPAARLKIGAHTVSFAVRPAEKQQLGRPLDELYGYPDESVFGILRANGAFVLRNAAAAAAPETGDSLVYAKSID